MGTPWNVRPITLRSDQELVFEDGVIVQAKRGEFMDGGASLFYADGISNVTLCGYRATLRMWKKDYQSAPYEKSQWRHALELRNFTGVRVLGLRIESSGGDGIYVGVNHGLDRPPY